MLQFDKLSDIGRLAYPFPHLMGSGLLPQDAALALVKDFPDPGRPGFYPVEECPAGSSFKALIDDLRSAEFSTVVGEKLGLELVGLPQMIVVRRWSAARDGRPHTDGPDKVATALLYLNTAWSSESGALRYLEGPDLDGRGGEPIRPDFGAFTAFARSDTSWHGHRPFEGERRVVQVFWLKDADALARKTKRHRRAGWLKSLLQRRM